MKSHCTAEGAISGLLGEITMEYNIRKYIPFYVCLCVCVCVYIYIYIYIYGSLSCTAEIGKPSL